ncbi:MAG: hypothetical protein U9O97_04355 [Elusimicrobiota bacterium]|nr:hypothetical protein [Elusimicrobiota bacterium]
MINKKLLLHCFSAALLFYTPAASAAAEPRYIANLPNIHEYELFSNNGWTGNWYVGYDHSWIVKLPPVKGINKFKKAFIGVKLGRAKTAKQLETALQTEINAQKEKLEGASPAEKENLVSEIESLKKKKESAAIASVCISVSENSDFSDNKKYIAAQNSEIPLDGDHNEALNNIGSAQWFWKEVPLSSISENKNNFVAVWSENALFTSASYAPVIAAGWSEKNKYAYLSTDNFGKAPKNLEKKISFFTPGLCIKLVPENNEKLKLKIKKAGINEGTLRVCAAVEGIPERLRLRVFRGKEEIQTGYGISSPPWCLTLYKIKKGRYSFYLEAEDYFGNNAKSAKKTFTVE